MRITKDDIPLRIDAPGARARLVPGFGTASGAMGAEYFSLAAGVDMAPLLKGLDHDLCQAPHWGYVLSGQVDVTYGDGAAETCVGGDLYYWPPGHTVRAVDDVELVMFSPQAEHGAVLDHVAARLSEAAP